MKYIILEVETKEGVKDVPVLFPDFIMHSEAARAFDNTLFRHHGALSVTAINAGFAKVKVDSIYGDSESLRLSPGPTDGAIIRRA